MIDCMGEDRVVNYLHEIIFVFIHCQMIQLDLKIYVLFRWQDVHFFLFFFLSKNSEVL